MSWHHKFIITISETARAKRALCFSKVVSSCPLSLPSVPSRSSTTVNGSMPTALAIQMPLVVWFLPFKASISLKFVPKRWLSKVLFPLPWGPRMETTA
uniref:RHD3 n=1 Tax=Arundo donax TaxID=35708 RepID=A0A0A9EWL1_ARUDO